MGPELLWELGFFRFLSALGLFFGSPVLSVSLDIILAAFWNWKLPFQRHVATFLEFEPLIFHGICNIVPWYFAPRIH